ncbi:hypothetical protein D6Z43_16380 [Pseudomonas sp. DY-1]|uniref:hypothetical protein n=1 Tax=Pseudomonas sp. DY-1 TaxID=1755504 RepID=UPI000EA96BD8|nr:hypothetical protein [Pseudomonas sp. DY-1]AYF88646.1 hypothetical protein D6Z43_16380 [Pseudomonas sp. DY-1]
MELTTEQIYALAVILLVMTALIAAAYCTGLKTGKSAGFEQGRTTATKYWKPFCRNLRKDLLNVEAQLDSRNREARALRLNIEQETSDHKAVERALREELTEARAYALTWDDQQTLIKATRQLGLAAQQFARSGSSKNNSAAIHRDALSALAAKVQAAIDSGHVHPDTELIEWLDREATVYGHGEEYVQMHFQLAADPTGYSHIRDVLKLAKQQSEEIEQNHAAILQEAAA